MEPDEIDDLARRAKAGDRDALESLLAAVRPRTLAICRGVLPYSSDAEDACQEALLNVATKIGSWNEQGRFTLEPQSKLRSRDGKIWTHPVISNGRLYLRDQELLFCFDVMERTASAR